MGISKEIENYEPTQLITLLEQSNAEMKKQTWLNFGNDDSISSKVIRTQTEQFLHEGTQIVCTVSTYQAP